MVTINLVLRYVTNLIFLQISDLIYSNYVKVSFMALTLLIGIRMDLCAIIHSFWLIILFSMKRKMLARVWRVYLYFIAVSLPVQYFLFIGIPPFLCFGNCFCFSTYIFHTGYLILSFVRSILKS